MTMIDDASQSCAKSCRLLIETRNNFIMLLRTVAFYISFLIGFPSNGSTLKRHSGIYSQSSVVGFCGADSFLLPRSKAFVATLVAAHNIENYDTISQTSPLTTVIKVAIKLCFMILAGDVTSASPIWSTSDGGAARV